MQIRIAKEMVNANELPLVDGGIAMEFHGEKNNN